MAIFQKRPITFVVSRLWNVWYQQSCTVAGPINFAANRGEGRNIGLYCWILYFASILCVRSKRLVTSGNGGWKMGRSLWNSLITISRLFPILSRFHLFVSTISRRRMRKKILQMIRPLFIASKRDNRQIRNIHGCQAKFDTTNHPLNHPTRPD